MKTYKPKAKVHVSLRLAPDLVRDLKKAARANKATLTDQATAILAAWRIEHRAVEVNRAAFVARKN